MKYANIRPFADPEKAARRIANNVEPVQDGRIHIEKVDAPILFNGSTPTEYKAGLELAIACGWLWQHESGTHVKFTPAGADLLA